MRKPFISESDGFIKLDDKCIHSKWIKKGDKVIVVTGNDKGKIGEIISREKNRVLVRGVNIRKKHQKREGDKGPGTIVSREMSIHITNVSVCSAEGKPVRLKARNVDGQKEVYYKDGPHEITHRKI